MILMKKSIRPLLLAFLLPSCAADPVSQPTKQSVSTSTHVACDTRSDLRAWGSFEPRAGRKRLIAGLPEGWEVRLSVDSRKHKLVFLIAGVIDEDDQLSSQSTKISKFLIEQGFSICLPNSRGVLARKVAHEVVLEARILRPGNEDFSMSGQYDLLQIFISTPR